MENDEDLDADEQEELKAPQGSGRLVVVGGGRGGVGKSLLAESLALYFAQLGKQVLLVDADATGSKRFLDARYGELQSTFANLHLSK